MKKILTLTTLLFSFACSYQNQTLDLALNLDKPKAQTTNAYEIMTRVIDLRENPEIVGTKSYYKKTISLLAKEPVAELLQKSLDKNLKARGFEVGNLRYLDLEIVELNYHSKKGIFVGSSNGEAKIKAIIRNYNQTKIFEKTFNLALGRKHMIISDLVTDQQIIENLIAETTNDILADKSIKQQLTK